MTTLDRMIFVVYIRSYLIVLTCLLALYINVDLFMNLDDFSSRGFNGMVKHVFSYYSAQVTQIFDRLSEFITLLAAVFTVAWIQRNNELLPQLSAGIPTRRVIRPILLGGLLTLALGPLNKEFLIPELASELSVPRDDPELSRKIEVKGAYDSTGVHMEGYAADRKTLTVIWMYLTFSEKSDSGMLLVTVKEAIYVPPGEGKYSGGWLLNQVQTQLDDTTLPANLEKISNGRYFLRTRDVDFNAITRGASWFNYGSTPDIRELLAKPDPRRQPAVAVEFHRRLTRPLIGILLVVMGLSLILSDQNRNIFVNAGLCLILSLVFYSFDLGCKYLGDGDYIAPALAAWLPVIVFGPFAFALVDAIHT